MTGAAGASPAAVPMTALITQADVELRISPRTLMELCDDNGDGVADSGVVSALLDQASQIARSALYPAFTAAQVDLLVAADSGAKASVVEICAGLAGSRRLHLLGPDGRSPFHGWLERAEQRLREAAAGQRRLVGEDAGGGNPTVQMRSETNPRTQLFSGSGGSGGF